MDSSERLLVQCTGRHCNVSIALAYNALAHPSSILHSLHYYPNMCCAVLDSKIQYLNYIKVHFDCVKVSPTPPQPLIQTQILGNLSV